jgi:hypothetical protein
MGQSKNGDIYCKELESGKIFRVRISEVSASQVPVDVIQQVFERMDDMDENKGAVES